MHLEPLPPALSLLCSLCVPVCLLAVAGVELVKLAGGVVVEAACIIELPELKGRSKLGGLPLHVLVEKEGL